MGQIKSGSDYIFTIERQTSFGTAIDTSPKQINTRQIEFETDGTIHNLARADGSRVDVEATSWNDTLAMVPTLKFRAPITLAFWKTILPGLLQKKTAWAAAASIWTLYNVDYADLPEHDLSGTSPNNGYFYTICCRTPVTEANTVNNDERFTDCILRSLKLSLHPTNDDGLLYGDFEFFARSYTIGLDLDSTITAADDPSSAWKWNASNRLVQWDASGTPVTLTTLFESFTLDMTWEAKNAFDVPRGPMVWPNFKATMSVKVASPGSTDIETMRLTPRSAAVSTGKVMRVCWGDGTVSSAGEMNIDVFGQLTAEKPDRSGDAEIQEFTVSAKNGNTASNEYAVRIQHHDS